MLQAEWFVRFSRGLSSSKSKSNAEADQKMHQKERIALG
jgi:hypothetical protein